MESADNSHEDAMPNIGYVFSVSSDTIRISPRPIFGAIDTVSCGWIEKSVPLSVGDKIVYRLKESPAGRTAIVERVLATGLPVVPSCSELMKQLVFCLDIEAEGLSEDTVRELMKSQLGTRIFVGKESKYDVLITITEDDLSRTDCALPLVEQFSFELNWPAHIRVPEVSEKTMAYFERISRRDFDKTKVRSAILALRIVHLTLHAMGYAEHLDLGATMKSRDAWSQEDPSLMPENLTDLCLMSWLGLHLMVISDDQSQSHLEALCHTCKDQPFPFGSDLQALLLTMDKEAVMKAHELPLQQDGVFYILGKTGDNIRVGLTPYRSTKDATIHSGMDSDEFFELETKFDVDMIIASELMNSELSHLDIGDKVWLRFQINLVNRGLLKVELVAQLGHVLIHNGRASLFGLKRDRLNMEVEIRWSANVNKKALRDASRRIGRITGWRMNINARPSPILNELSRDVEQIEMELASNNSNKTQQEAVRKLNTAYDAVSPKFSDVIDHPRLIVFVLPSSRVGIREGEAKLGVFAWVRMPRPVIAGRTSVSCESCSKNYAFGREVKESEILFVLIMHEILHISAGLPDHKGECALCRFNQPEMFPLRTMACDPCIQGENNYVHRNCIMSYACDVCCASRTSEITSISDFLCTSCLSLVPSIDSVVRAYMKRVNGLYLLSMMEAEIRKKIPKLGTMQTT